MSIRSARLALSLAAAFVAFASMPLSAPAGEPAAKAGSETLKPEERIRRALRSPTELELQETPLDDVVNLIKETHKIEVQIDKKALDDVGIALDTPITKDVKRISLRSALRLMLTEHDLTYMVRDEVLLITTPEVADQQMTTTVYDVADLVVQDEKSDEPPDFESLSGLLTECIQSPTWDCSGGPGAVSRFGGGGIRALVVSQNQEVHEEVVGLLRVLRALRPVPPDEGKAAKPPALVKPAEGRVLPEPSAADKAILQALQKPTDLETVEQPLHKVVDLLKEKHKIEIQLDKKALDDVGIAADTLVTKSLKGISLRSALNLMLRELDLTYMIWEEVLLITTPEVADQYLHTKVYDVADLVQGNAGSSGQLANAITNCIRESTWHDTGGPGVVQPFNNSGIHALVVANTQEVHEEIVDLLAQFRQLRRAKAAEDKRAKGKPPAKAAAAQNVPPVGLKPAADMLPKLGAADQRIAAALDKPISLKFENASLEEVVTVLGKRAGIPVRLDTKAIDVQVAAAKDEDDADPVPKPLAGRRRINLQVADVKLRSALPLLLGPLELDWTIIGGSLLITTREVATCMLCTRTYDVSDLSSFQNEQGQGVPGFEMLIDAITATVDRKSWDDAGGPAVILPLELDGIQAIVVSQTWRNHEKVSSLLTDLRKNRKRLLTKTDIERMPLAPPPGFRHAPGTLADNAVQIDPDDPTPFLPLKPLKPLPADAKRDAVVLSNSQFACDLYAKLREGSKDNLFFSPYSVSTVLAMTYAGARGETAREMAAALHFTLPQEELHPAAGSLLAAIQDAGGQPGCRLQAANRLWMQQGARFLDPFLATMRQSYAAEPAVVDFREPQAAARAINQWVEEQTDRRIKDIVPPAALDPAMQLVLTNAVHFKGKWESPFLETNTRPTRFFTGADRSVWVQMMKQQQSFGYASVEGLLILDLPYRGGNVSMMILLPEKGAENFAKLEGGLNAGNLQAWADKLKWQEVEVYLPRFKYETSLQLGRTLQSVGMKLAFDRQLGVADLSGIDGGRNLCIWDVLHKTYVSVDETGTEAAAASAMMGGFGMAGPPPPPPPVFRADHPFLYMIRDNRTGTILFLGRLMSPPAAALSPGGESGGGK